jgi:4-amino-4-deoxy-L-arabinose transferase-like glycosyltransferase
MMKALKSPILHIIFLGIISVYIFFYQLGSLALTDPDETFYALTAREMLERGDHLTPHIHGRPQFEKPILFYSLVEASFKAFGVNEFAARLPSAVSGMIGVILMYLLGSLLFSRTVGLSAGLILATNVEYIVVARACVTDMLLAMLTLLGLLLFFYGQRREKGIYYVLSSASFALAVLTKGPIGILLPAVIILAYLVITKDFKVFKKPWTLISCILVFIAISLPWYAAMYRLHGKPFIDAFFGFQNVTRFLVPEHEIGSQFWFYVPVLFGGFFPWSAFLPFGLWHISVRAKNRKKHSIFILIWFAVIFLFFSASSTKLVTYVFTAFPALALIVAVAWSEFLKGSASSGVRTVMKASYYLLVAVIAGGIIGFYFFIRSRYPSLLFDAAVAGVFLAFGFLLSLAAFLAARYKTAFFLTVYSVVVFLLPLDTLVIPEIERFETSKDIAAKLSALAKPGEAIGSEKDYRAGAAFYTGKSVSDITAHHLLTQFLNSARRVWCVMKEKNHIQLYELKREEEYYKPSYMVYRYGKKCIVTNAVPDDGKYLTKREGRQG